MSNETSEITTDGGGTRYLRDVPSETGKPLSIVNDVDRDGNPAGGHVCGRGIFVTFQNGPLGRGAERAEPNGAFVEDVIQVAIERLAFYQRGKFACTENNRALKHLTRALVELHERTKRREARGVEGTHAH